MLFTERSQKAMALELQYTLTKGPMIIWKVKGKKKIEVSRGVRSTRIMKRRKHGGRRWRQGKKIIFIVSGDYHCILLQVTFEASRLPPFVGVKNITTPFTTPYKEKNLTITHKNTSRKYVWWLFFRFYALTGFMRTAMSVVLTSQTRPQMNIYDGMKMMNASKL